MKILYIASERRDAKSAATALRSLAPDVAVLWTARFDHAAQWIRQTPDIKVLVVEAQVDARSSIGLLKHVRTLGPNAPAVVVVVPEGNRPPRDLLEAGADGYIAKNELLFRDLPGVVSRVLQRPPTPAAHAAAVASGAWNEQRLEEPKELEELLCRERETRDHLRNQLAQAEAALREADERHASALKSASAQFARREAEYESRLARAAVTWEMVEEQLREGAARVERARQDEASAAANVERRSRREAELSHLLAEATAARGAFEQQLADTKSALEAATDEATATRRALEQQLTDARSALQAAIEDARQRQASAEEAARREAELEVRVHQEVQGRQAVEEELAHAEAARKEAEERHVAAMARAAAELAERQARFEAELAQAAAARETLGEQLRRAAAATEESARREAEFAARIGQEVRRREAAEEAVAREEGARKEGEERHAAAMARAAAELTERQARFETELAQACAAREALGEQLRQAAAAAERAAQHEAELQAQVRGAEAGVEDARRDRDSAAGEVDRLTRREAELSNTLAAATASCSALEQQVADSRSELQAAVEDATRQRLTAAERAAQREAVLETQARRAEAAAEEARQDLAAAAAEADRLRRREAELSHLLAEATATRSALAQQLTGARSALEAATEEATATRGALERRLADAETALRAANEDAARQRQAAADEAAQRDAEFAEQLRVAEVAAAEAAQRQAELEAQLRRVQAAAEGARQDHASAVSEVDRLTEREGELSHLLAEATAGRNAHEQQLADARSAFQAEAEDATRQRLAAAEQAAQREAALETRLGQEVQRRQAVEEELARAGAARQEAEERHASERATAAAEFAERQAWFETELSQTAAARDALGQQAADLRAALVQADHDLTSAAAEVERLTRRESELSALVEEAVTSSRTLESRLADATAAVKDGDARLQRETDVRETLERELAGSRLAFDAAQQRSGQEAAEQGRREAELRAQIQHLEEERDVLRTRHDAQLQERAARNREFEQLQGKLAAVMHDLDAVKKRGTVLQAEADKVPQLAMQLEELRRQMQHLPLAICRCTGEGTLALANRAFAALLGYKNAEQLRSVPFASIFESADDLTSLLDRCLQTHATETLETVWRTRNGSRLVVLLSAFASESGTIEIVAEDLTNLRTLQQRVDKSQRMEAIGRLASEVAITCANLLTDVNQDGQQWLATLDGDTALRQQGEMLFAEVRRAASFLQQLAAHDDDQAVPEPGDLNRVLYDLEPILKRVVGDQIELVLPQTASRTSAPLDVDVRTERLERLLVNVANYGRQRMPSGGRLVIELGTAVVGRRFAAKYPNVRQGRHALITITGVQTAAGANGPLSLGDQATGPGAGKSATERPGVDLGALQWLVRESGGHLWMNVEPPGDMVMKIHLPLRRPEDSASARPSIFRGGRGRAMGHWFRL